MQTNNLIQMSFLMRKNAYFKLAKIRKKNDFGKFNFCFVFLNLH